jgi:selenocysteine-specific elongation factor
MHVIGTAGHVDHGKTALIEALTGINADRLPEEKRRGLTIDLGFAHFFTPQGAPVGVIDVPGHERFIRNMVAGAWSLDLALLTVAADDGWMQQSSDHTRVLRLMGVPRLIAAITKSDLTSPEQVDRISEQVVEECGRLGYESIPTVAVSARSGQGIDQLRQLILKQLEDIRVAEPMDSKAPYLYVDRVFTVKGSGVVVTGSLKGGSLEPGQELQLLPQDRRVRIRGLQSYYKECERVGPVSRVALNLSGIAAGEIDRGDLLIQAEGSFRVVEEIILRLTPELRDESIPPLKRDTQVEMAAGTGHQIVRMTRWKSSNLARIRLSREIPLLWNQPIVLIRHGGAAILGGGRVLWLGGSSRQQRDTLAKIEPQLPERLGPEHLGRLKLLLEGAVTPKQAEDLGLKANLESDAVELDGWIVLQAHLDRLEARLRELAGQPGGVRLDELTTKMQGEPQALLPQVADRLCKQGTLTTRGGILFPAGAQAPQVSPMGRQLLRDLQSGGINGLELSKLKIAGARKELRNLARADLAIALDGDIYYEKQVYLDLVGSCLAGLEVGGSLTIAAAKERTGLSRKYIIPLLNRMESDGYVKREGDERIVTAKPGSYAQ